MNLPIPTSHAITNNATQKKNNLGRQEARKQSKNGRKEEPEIKEGHVKETNKKNKH